MELTFNVSPCTSPDVHAKVILVVTSHQGFNDLCIAVRVELQEVFVLCHDAETTRCAF
jgi:hypothetical protein